MRPEAIRIHPDSPGVKLSDTSRINYAKTYTIEYNLRVASIGSVSRETLPHLLRQYLEMSERGLGRLQLAESVRRMRNDILVRNTQVQNDETSARQV